MKDCLYSVKTRLLISIFQSVLNELIKVCYEYSRTSFPFCTKSSPARRVAADIKLRLWYIRLYSRAFYSLQLPVHVKWRVPSGSTDAILVLFSPRRMQLPRLVISIPLQYYYYRNFQFPFSAIHTRTIIVCILPVPSRSWQSNFYARFCTVQRMLSQSKLTLDVPKMLMKYLRGNLFSCRLIRTCHHDWRVAEQSICRLPT